MTCPSSSTKKLREVSSHLRNSSNATPSTTSGTRIGATRKVLMISLPGKVVAHDRDTGADAEHCRDHRGQAAQQQRGLEGADDGVVLCQRVEPAQADAGDREAAEHRIVERQHQHDNDRREGEEVHQHGVCDDAIPGREDAASHQPKLLYTWLSPMNRLYSTTTLPSTTRSTIDSVEPKGQSSSTMMVSKIIPANMELSGPPRIIGVM